MSLENDKGEMLTSAESDNVSLWGAESSKLQKTKETANKESPGKKNG